MAVVQLIINPMGNGCFTSQAHQQSPSYEISHGNDSGLSIFCEITKKQSQISYPLKLETLDNFDDGFFQKEFAFIEPVVKYLVEASTQTLVLDIYDQGLKFNNVSTQTQIAVQKECRLIEQAVSQPPSRILQSDKQQARLNRASYYKTAMKKTGNLVGLRANRNSQNSLERQFELSPYQNKRYMTPNQKKVRFADSKFSLPVL